MITFVLINANSFVSVVLIASLYPVQDIKPFFGRFLDHHLTTHLLVM